MYHLNKILIVATENLHRYNSMSNINQREYVLIEVFDNHRQVYPYICATDWICFKMSFDDIIVDFLSSALCL